MLPCKQGQLAFNFISMINYELELSLGANLTDLEYSLFSHDAKCSFWLHLETLQKGK